jgi:hypothetical protein
MLRGCHGRVRMIVGFTTTYAINAYHHLCCEFESRSCEVYLIQHYVIKFISDLWQVVGFLRVLRFHATKKTDRHNITESRWSPIKYCLRKKNNVTPFFIGVMAMVFNTTFNNISVILWRSVFFVAWNRSTRRKPTTCHKSLINFIT